MQSDKISVANQFENYLDIKIRNTTQEMDSPSLVEQFNCRLKRCIK
jgi:hypothetical protein